MNRSKNRPAAYPQPNALQHMRHCNRSRARPHPGSSSWSDDRGNDPKLARAALTGGGLRASDAPRSGPAASEVPRMSASLRDQRRRGAARSYPVADQTAAHPRSRRARVLADAITKMGRHVLLLRLGRSARTAGPQVLATSSTSVSGRATSASPRRDRLLHRRDDAIAAANLVRRTLRHSRRAWRFAVIQTRPQSLLAMWHHAPHPLYPSAPADGSTQAAFWSWIRAHGVEIAKFARSTRRCGCQALRPARGLGQPGRTVFPRRGGRLMEDFLAADLPEAARTIPAPQSRPDRRSAAPLHRRPRPHHTRRHAPEATPSNRIGPRRNDRWTSAPGSTPPSSRFSTRLRYECGAPTGCAL